MRWQALVCCHVIAPEHNEASSFPFGAIRRYIGLKYYHYTLWTGLYMLDPSETRVINIIVGLLCAYFVRWCVRFVSWGIALL